MEQPTMQSSQKQVLRIKKFKVNLTRPLNKYCANETIAQTTKTNYNYYVYIILHIRILQLNLL